MLISKITIDDPQVYFWTRRWQQGEQEAEADLQQGNYQDFDSMDDFIRSLEQDIESDEILTPIS